MSQSSRGQEYVWRGAPEQFTTTSKEQQEEEEEEEEEEEDDEEGREG